MKFLVFYFNRLAVVVEIVERKFGYSVTVVSIEC